MKVYVAILYLYDGFLDLEVFGSKELAEKYKKKWEKHEYHAVNIWEKEVL